MAKAARKGRPRKAGRRTDTDRLSRAGAIPSYDKGSERIQAMRERYGEHYSSAIGRAYVSGLLGEESIARVRYDTGKRFQRAVERFFEVGRVKCPLGAQRVSGGLSVQITANPFEEAEWQWIIAMADKLDDKGLRPWLDQLTLGTYHDAGPYWLDALLDGGKHPADLAVLNAAISALDLITPSQPVSVIRVVRS